MKRYRIPTHLTIEPSLVRTELGPLAVDLTFRQAAILACAAGFAYWLWHGSGLPEALAVALSLAALALSLLAAFAAVSGRSADLWLRDALRHLARPRRLVWRPDAIPAPRPEEAGDAGPPLAVAWAAPRPAEAPAD